MKSTVYDYNKAKCLLYRQVFQTREGQAVLTDILNDLNFFALPEEAEPGQVELRNFATRLLFKLGITTMDNRSKVIEALLSVPLPENTMKELDDYGR